MRPKLKKMKANFEYYDSIHIENRDDIDCEKVLIFIKKKIFYNFLNEHNDIINFLEECQNKKRF